MTDRFPIRVNGQEVLVFPGTSIAAAVLQTEAAAFFHSPKGQPRAPLCGMGICYQCQILLNGQSLIKSCQLICQPGMEVQTLAEPSKA